MTTSKNTLEKKRSKIGLVKKTVPYLMGFGTVFIASALAFCPVTQAVLNTKLLPQFSNLFVNFASLPHLVFFSLLVIGLGMRSEYQR